MTPAIRRSAVVLAALVGPLVGAGAAQAAIAGAQPERATVTPVLISATVDAAAPNAADFCFDKAVLPGTATNDFAVVGYSVLTESFYSRSVSSVSANCVRASFQVANLRPYTIAYAKNGAVTSAGGTNNPDTTPLLGSTSHAGTRNVASGPNLAGVASSTATASGNQYIFTFDKDVVAPTTQQASNFYIVGADGRETDGQSATPVASNAVAVTFAVADSNGQSTANAFLGGVRQGAAYGQYDVYSPAQTPNVDESSLIPYASNPPSEFAPYLTGAALNAEDPSTGDESVTYTFSQGVNPYTGGGAGQPSPTQFKLELADGIVLSADSVTTQAAGPTTTVTANFTTARTSQSPYAGNTYTQEFGVVAYADTGAATTYSATSPTSGVPSAASSAPIGGNSGAFAEGFTTAPDVTGITIAHNANGGTNDVLTINLDDRTLGGSSGVTPTTLTTNTYIQYRPGFTYYDGTGALITSGPPTPLQCAASQGSTLYATTTPGPMPETVTCLYAPNALNGIAAVGFGYKTFYGTAAPDGTLDGENGASAPQIDSPISTSAIVRAYRINVAHMKAKHHRARHHAKRTRKR